MASVIRDPLIEMVTARWDCGPGCGTTGCGNSPRDLERYRLYRDGVPYNDLPPKSVQDDPPKRRQGWLHRLFVRLAEWTR